MAQKSVKDPTHVQIRLHKIHDQQLIENWERWTHSRKKADVFRDMGALYAAQEQFGFSLVDLAKLQESLGMPLHKAVALLPKIYQIVQQGTTILPSLQELEGTKAEQDEGLVVDLDMVARWDL